LSELYLPTEATWRQAGPRPATAAGVDGAQLADPVTVNLFIEPLSPKIAETKYGVVGVERPHFAMFDPAEVEGIREDDTFEWGGMTLLVKAVKVYPVQVEAVLGARTRGR
jgi:hypothetical protein